MYSKCSSCARSSAIQFSLLQNLKKARKSDAYQRTPLHLACCYHEAPSTQILEKILLKAPKTSLIKDVYGYTPLELLCLNWNSSFDSIRLFLKLAPVEYKFWSTIDSPSECSKHNPLKCLLFRYNMHCYRRSEKLLKIKTIQDVLHDKSIHDLWQKASFLIRSRHRDRLADNNNNNNNNLPSDDELNCIRETGVACLYLNIPWQLKKMAVQLMTASVDLSKPCPKTGRYVLHDAINAGLNWNDYLLNHIITAAPEVVNCVDHETGLLPYMLAAASVGSGAKNHRMRHNSCKEEENCSERLDLVFELMRSTSIKLIPSSPVAHCHELARSNNNMCFVKSSRVRSSSVRAFGPVLCVHTF